MQLAFGILSNPEPQNWLLSLRAVYSGKIALDACTAAISQDHRTWAHSMFKAIRGTGYQLDIRCDDLDQIDFFCFVAYARPALLDEVASMNSSVL